MSDIWVVNASPLISLAEIGCEHLLTTLAPTVLIPTAVAAEILAGPPSDPARKLLELGWAQSIEPSSLPAIVIEWGLGSGESAVLAVALENPGSTAVLDDAAARTAARSMSIPVIGTLGIIIRAKQRQHLPSAAAVIAQLKSAGLYLDDNMIRTVLQQVGETWPPTTDPGTTSTSQGNQ